MRGLTFIIFIISKFKFVALLVTLKSKILTFIFSGLLIMLDIFLMEALKFYERKLGSGDNNNGRAYRKLKGTN